MPTVSTQRKIIVYTCVAGDYDREIAPVEPNENLVFVCFTNSKYLSAPGWEIRDLVPTRPGLDNQAINRFHKLFPHLLFLNASWSIYVDGNISFSGNWRDAVEAVAASNATIGAFTHPHNHNLLEEVAACRRFRKFTTRDDSLADLQVAEYGRRGIDLSKPITENNFLVRNHECRSLAPLMSIWWSQLFEWTSRDQISLSYALEASKAKLVRLDNAGLKNGDISRVAHSRTFAQKIRKAVRRALNFVKKFLS